MSACEREQASECVYVRDAWQGVNGWILRDWVCTRVTVCEYEWILKHYPRMNVARIKACNRVTIRCIFSVILAATQWYHFSRVVIFPFACDRPGIKPRSGRWPTCLGSCEATGSTWQKILIYRNTCITLEITINHLKSTTNNKQLKHS